MTVSSKEKHIIAEFMKEYSERLGNDGCNDWYFPTDWTVAEKQQFIKEYYAWNGTPEEYSKNHLHLPNFAAISFLAYRIEKKTVGYNFKIKTPKSIKETWLLGYLDTEQIEDLSHIKEEIFPIDIVFSHNGLRGVTQVYDHQCNLLMNITKNED